VEGFVGQFEYGSVIPEGGDDLELRTASARTLAQVKSRRDHMGPFSARSVAGFVMKMWDGKGLQPDDQFLLVLESNIGERCAAIRQLQDLSTYPTVVVELKGRKGLAGLIARTKVLVLPDPRGSAVAQISARQACTSFEAEMYFADLLGVVGHLSDDNGTRAASAYLGLAVSDVQQRFDALQPLLTSAVVEAALTEGFCSAVDFLTPDEDPLFYLGVDAQASHVAAGLVVERPELRAAILDGLESRRNALIHGASGSGKSAVLWEAAYASRHAVRWFQIQRLPPTAIASLVQLARSRRATADAPVGFIIDDVGRGFSEGWTALTAELNRTPGLLLLASVREEDRYPLVDSRRAAQVKVQGDDTLAERVWRELRDRGQTAWQGWREPWMLAAGHLLEYTHVLTQGHRLSETLHAQVAARINDINRHDELDVLRTVACVNAAGCSAEVSELPRVLSKPATTVSLALTRLKNEHLVQDAHEGRIVGLHDLRSAELLRQSHEFPPPLLSTTAATAVWLVPASEMSRFLERTLSRHEECDDEVIEGLALRLETAPTPALLGAILTGLDRTNAHRVIRRWLQTVEAQAMPKSLLGTPAGLAISDIEPPDIGPTVPASRRFTEIRADVIASGLTARFLARLAPSDLRRVLQAASSVGDLTQLMASLLGQVIPTSHLGELATFSPPLVEADFQTVVSLLQVTARVDRALAISWVNAVGQDSLFQRFSDNVAWAEAPSLSPCEEGQEVRSDIWFVAPSVQTDLNHDVYQTCETLLALTPAADIVSSDALGADGVIVPSTVEDYPLARKRMPRANVPAPEQVARNRAWLAILNAYLATESYTAYLAQCLDLLNLLVPNLRALLDGQFRGKTDATALNALGRVYDAAISLVAPQEEPLTAGVQRWSRLPSILSSCSTDLVRRFLALPQGAPAYMSWLSDIQKSIATAASEESWGVLSIEAPKELDELQRLVEMLQTMAGESEKRGRHPFLTHRSRTAPKGSALGKAALAARQYRETELNNLEGRLRTELTAISPGIGVHLLAEATIPEVWPPADVLVTLPVNSDGTGVDLANGWPAWRALIEGGRKICVLPVMNRLGLMSLATSGFDRLFPVLPNELAQPWCAAAGLKAAPMDSLNVFTRLTNPLAELQGIDAYWSSKGTRTPEEERIYRAVSETLDEAREAWSNLALTDDIKGAGLQLMDAALQGDVPIANAAARLLHGERTQTIDVIESFVLGLTLFDCQCTGERSA
jgi:DNA-binding transcriptional ArsR family regulator